MAKFQTVEIPVRYLPDGRPFVTARDVMVLDVLDAIARWGWELDPVRSIYIGKKPKQENDNERPEQ